MGVEHLAFAMHSYRELEVWRLGMELAREVYLFTRGFPREEIYGLTSQARRAAVSIPANIAEGHAKYFTDDSDPQSVTPSAAAAKRRASPPAKQCSRVRLRQT
jgi:hypothetical protein